MRLTPDFFLALHLLFVHDAISPGLIYLSWEWLFRSQVCRLVEASLWDQRALDSAKARGISDYVRMYHTGVSTQPESCKYIQ